MYRFAQPEGLRRDEVPPGIASPRTPFGRAPKGGEIAQPPRRGGYRFAWEGRTRSALAGLAEPFLTRRGAGSSDLGGGAPSSPLWGREASGLD